MINKKNTEIIIFSILTLFFTGVILLSDIFFNWEDLKDNIEEKYIEESLFSSEEIHNIKYIEIAKKIIKDGKIEDIKKEIKEENKIKEKEKIITNLDIKKINFAFIPNKFKIEQNDNKIDIWIILENNIFYYFLKEINILFYEKKWDVRWKMKNKQIKIFWPQHMEEDELMAIFIHEFAHYIDIYFLKRDGWKDISNEFYNISWNSTKVIKSWLTEKDFVSGYWMTNKYEDFAESLTYYILHNRDFFKKSLNSEILRKKYNFFNFILFKSEIFKSVGFSKNKEVKNYYRDITKIHFYRKNFLQYLKKYI